MLRKWKLTTCSTVMLALSLSGCGTLASNGLDYASYKIPAIPAAPSPTPPPPPPAPPPCQMPAAGQMISLAGCKTGDTLVLRGVNFEFNKATLTLNAKGLLDQVATALMSRPDIKVEIDGHTDGKGSVKYNQRLSQERAIVVKNYLVTHNIPAGNLSARGFGKSMPIADNATEEGRALNRRVELKVIDSAPPALPPPTAEAPPAPSPATDHSSVVILEPVPAFLQEPGAGLPTSIGVVTTVPKPVESGPAAVTSQRALPQGYAGNQPSLVGYPGSSGAPAYSAPAATPASPPAAAPAAYSAPTAAPQVSTGSGIAISNYTFTPETLTIAAGTTVTWTNKDNVMHFVKFADQASDHLATGASYSRTFSKPGEYPYQCGIHPFMTGKIIVE